MVSLGRMMWGTCSLVWGRVGTLGVEGTLGYGVNTLGYDGGETVEGTGEEIDVEDSSKMVAQ